MERSKTKRKADAILTSDWHLRETQPVCRTDNFWEAQWKKVDFVKDLQQEHGCPVIHAGDLFDYWKPSPYLLSATMEHIPNDFHTIYGQHDLPQHNWDERYRSGIYALDKAQILGAFDSIYYSFAKFHFTGIHWGQTPEKVYREPIPEDVKRSILVWHKMVWQGKKLWPGQTDPNAAAILRKYPKYDLILTGDNHKPFTETYEKAIIVNPGSLTRQDADQMEHKPRVYLYFSDDNSIRPVYLPIASGVISREHIDRVDQRDQRIQAYIEKLNTDWAIELSFERNLEEFFKKNQVRSSVKELTYKAIEQ